MSRVSITDAYEEVEVDLWGSIYTVKPITKAIATQVEGAQEEFQNKLAETKNISEIIGLLGTLSDLRLEPANGGRKKASTLFREKWDAGELNLPQIQNFWTSVGEAENNTENDRPT